MIAVSNTTYNLTPTNVTPNRYVVKFDYYCELFSDVALNLVPMDTLSTVIDIQNNCIGINNKINLS